MRMSTNVKVLVSLVLVVLLALAANNIEARYINYRDLRSVVTVCLAIKRILAPARSKKSIVTKEDARRLIGAVYLVNLYR
ncbi:unnamed protein product [Brassica oleracea var. botrytis]